MNESFFHVIREAGKIMLQARDIDETVKAKEGARNFVTAYDSAVQKFLFTELAKLYPDVAFVGEEDSADDIARLSAGRAFVIDPIDGTQNFIKNASFSAISVALCEGGDVVMGAVYNPYADEMYWAEAGSGAYLTTRGQTRRLQVSDQPLENGLVIAGIAPYYTELHDRTFRSLRKVFDHALDIRSLGSAALGLCAVAAGRAEIYMEMRLCPWDYAAGVCIIREAGGVITQLDGTPIRLDTKCSVLAGNPKSHAAAVQLEL